MQPLQISAIALGNWNPKIFTPQWVNQQLLNIPKDSEIEILIDFNDMDFALKYKNLFISPKRNLLELKITSFEPKDLEQLEYAIFKVFELLPHTPVKAIGINVLYEIKEKDSPKPFEYLKNSSYFTGQELNMVRHSLVNDGFQTNIIFEKASTEAMTITFNFHYLKINNIGKSFLEGHIIEANKYLSYAI